MLCSSARARAATPAIAPISELVVAVPMRNEAARAAQCLLGVQDAITALMTDATALRRTGVAPRVTTVVTLDSCVDQTSDIVACFPWVRVVRTDAGRVGAARALGVEWALSGTIGPLSRTWIVNTDADSRVPRDWLTHQLSLADVGADAVCGLVDPDPSECGPSRYAAWLAAYRPVDNHPHVHGANLGIRADCYLDCGGFASSRRAHEDVGLVRAAEARGWNVVASRGATVHTSGRIEGRVPADGFAGYLRSCPSGATMEKAAVVEVSA